MAKVILLVAGAIVLLFVLVFILSAAFAYGFNTMGAGLAWPVIGWEEGIGALIMFSVAGAFVGGSSITARR